MNRHLIVCIVLLLGFVTALKGQVIQSKKAWLEAGDSSMHRKDYYAAFKFYEAALEYDTSAIQVWFKFAECARHFNANEAAERGYVQVLTKDATVPVYPEARLWLAVVRHRLEKHSLALADYGIYLKNAVTSQPSWANLAQKGIQECTRVIQAQEIGIRSGALIIRPQRADSTINGAYSDFGAVLQGDTMFFTSFREAKDPQNPKKTRLALRVLQAANGQPAVELGDNFNLPNQHIAYSAFTPDNQGVYYAVCEYLNASDMRCDLYYRQRLGADKWGIPLRLSINQAGFTSTQPAVGVDGTTGQYRLYFVSDRPGGKKGLDLWTGVIAENGDVVSAENLMHVNTDGEDIAPFFHNASQLLYFSTDGRVGLGGYDVFQAKLQPGNTWGPIKELGYQVNSSYDDVYFSLNTAGDRALISSNRKGSTPIIGKDAQSEEEIVCCYDIYRLPINLKVTLHASTFYLKDSTALSGSTVQVFELTPDGERLVSSLTNLEGNDFEFELSRNKKYRIVAQQKDLTSDEAFVDLNDLDPDQQEIQQDLFQDQLDLNLEVQAFDAVDRSKLSGVRCELFELLDGDTVLVGVVVNEIGNTFNYTIRENRRYWVKLTKMGYDSAMQELVITPEDVKKFGRQLTVELELDRIDFPILPIALYFDNSMPDGRSLSRTTQTEYASQNKAYYARKQDYINQVTASGDADQRFGAAQVYESFFEREVRDGLNNLMEFSNQLLKYLSRGHSLEIELKGYASPRASAQFNEIISQRRISCVENFFRTYKNGQFLPYLKNGQFIITERALGESTAQGNVPDRLDDITGSIFSMLACVERRVEIVKVRAQIAKPQ